MNLSLMAMSMYPLLDKVDIPKVSGKVATKQSTQTTATNKESEVDGQVSLFELA